MVRIGFNPTTYSVHEDQGSVSVAVSVISGMLARAVVVSLQTLNGTALGKLNNPSQVTLMKYIANLQT